MRLKKTEERTHLSLSEKVEEFHSQQRKRLAELIMIDLPCLLCANRGFGLEKPDGTSIRCKACHEQIKIVTSMV